MAFGSANVQRKKVDTSGFVTKKELENSGFVTSTEFDAFQQTYQSTYESAKAAGYTGTEADFYLSLNDLIINGGSEGSIEVNTQTVTLTTEWTKQADGTHAQTVVVEGVTGDSAQPIWVDCALTREDIDADIAVLEAWDCINTVEPAEGSLVFYCYGNTPAVSIPVNVVVM